MDKINRTPKGLMVNPDSDQLDLTDAISERLHKASGVITCLAADQQHEKLNPTVTGDALWCVEGLIDEAIVLLQQQMKRRQEEKEAGEVNHG